MTDQEQKRVQAAIDKANRETLSALLRIVEAKATGNDKELIEAIKQTPEEIIEKALPVMIELITPPHSERTEDEQAIDRLLFGLFDEWIDEITAEGAQRDLAPLQFFFEVTGAKPQGILTFMYEAFIAGVGKGMELVQRIEAMAATT